MKIYIQLYYIPSTSRMTQSQALRCYRPSLPGVILLEADCMTEATRPAFRTGRVKLCMNDPVQRAEMLTDVVMLSRDLLEIILNYPNRVYPREENSCQPILP